MTVTTTAPVRTAIGQPVDTSTGRGRRQIRLSALDLMPIRADQNSRDAVTATVEAARTADAAGYNRYWVAEHHGMATFATTAPAVAIAQIAALTVTIRVGSGGVMLPNHSPLAVAEQFALLEAAFPGRIDLGVGRAPGGDPIAVDFLRRGRTPGDFGSQLDDLRALLSRQGLDLSAAAGGYRLRATPAAVSEPALWLLGSSTGSASLAAQRGLPYVFDHHFLGDGTKEALDVYRQLFRPSATLNAPETLVTTTVVVAPTREEAEARALPMLQTMAMIVTGQPLEPLALVEDALQRTLTSRQHQVVEAMRERFIVGTPADAAAEIEALADEFDVSEIMVNTVASMYKDDPENAPDPRAETLRLLADALSVRRPAGGPR